MNAKYYQQLLISTLLLLPGCASLHQSFQKPHVNTPSSWYSHDSETKLSKPSLKPRAWWQKFKDPQLNALIDKALKNNNDLHIATGHIFEAQASLQKAQYSWLPSLNATAAGFRGEISDIDLKLPKLGALPTLPINTNNLNKNAHFNGYAAGFVPSYSLNILQQISQGHLARANLAMNIAEQNAVRLGVVSQVSGSYFNLLGLKRQLTLQTQMIKDAKALKNYTKIQYQHGAISSMNLETLAQFIAILEKQTPEIQDKITEVQNAIQVLINENPAPIITDNHFEQVSTEGIIPIYTPTETLQLRPDVAIAEAQLEMADAKVGVAISELFPSFSLTGLGGLASIELGNLLSLSSGIGLGQVIAGIPIINMQIYAEIKKAKGQKYALYYHYLKTVRTALADADNALSHHASIKQGYTQQALALSRAKSQLNLLNTQYKEGAIAYSKTIMAQLNVDYMQAKLNELKMQQMDSIVRLYQAFAGG